MKIVTEKLEYNYLGMTNSNTGGIMSVAKITISVEARILEILDQFIQSKVFGNRSQAF